MCREQVTIAMCAPNNAPSLSFTCGGFHLVSDGREMCENAVGSCLCFFGSCGRIDKAIKTTAVDFTELKKVRCMSCTAREDDVGDRRSGVELIHSPLLARKPITSPEGMKKFKDVLKNLWGGKAECPFHHSIDAGATDVDNGAQDGKSTAATPVDEQGMNDQPTTDFMTKTNATKTFGDDDSKPRNKYPADSTAQQAPAATVTPTITVSDARGALKELLDAKHEQESAGSGLTLDVGLATSRWANASAPAPAQNQRQWGKTTPSTANNTTTNNNAGNRFAQSTKMDKPSFGGIKLSQLAAAKEFLRGH